MLSRTSSPSYPRPCAITRVLVLREFYGALTVGVNLDAPDNVAYLDHFLQGKAGEILPGLVEEWVAEL